MKKNSYMDFYLVFDFQVFDQAKNCYRQYLKKTNKNRDFVVASLENIPTHHPLK